MRAHLPFLLLAMILTSCDSDGDEQNAPPSNDAHDSDTHDGDTQDSDTQDSDDVSDPDEPPHPVQVQPDAFDLGTIDPRCALDLAVTLTAAGDDSPGLFTVTAPDGWMVSAETFELSTGASSTVQLSWDGTQDDPSGSLHFDFEAYERITVPLWALPERPQDHVSVDLGQRADADLLLVVDRSCNMDDMARLEPSWPVLRSRLADAGVALRMASVVEDDGCVLGDPIVLDDALDDDDFRAELWRQQNWRGNWGIYTEKLLALSSIALAASCNAELVQGNAPLHVLAFSDEPDQSDRDWSVYVEQMAQLTDPGVPFTVHGIGKESEDCDIAQWYTGVLEATESTGGVFLDFCTDDWDDALTELADGIADASRRVVLSTLPNLDGEIGTVYTDAGELTGWSLEDDHLLLPSDADLSGELTLQIWLSPTCEE